ncbi:hypothetical protein D3C73_875380 [compost metagenome]
MRRGRVGGVADQQDAAAVPGLVDEDHFHRLVDHLAAVGDLLTQFADEAGETLQALAHLLGQRRRVHPWVGRFVGREEQVHQVTGQRHQAGVAFGTLVVGEVIDLRVTREVVAPHRLAGETRCVGVAEDQVANPGEQTVGADHQVVHSASAIGE